MKTLIVLTAIAGSGKSTWANQYASTHENVHIVSSDEIRVEVTGRYQDLDHEKEVWKRYWQYLKKYFDTDGDVTVIADSTAITNRKRLRFAPKIKNIDKKILVIIRKPLDVILKQNKMRRPDKIVPEKAIYYMVKHWQEPDWRCRRVFDEILDVTMPTDPIK